MQVLNDREEKPVEPEVGFLPLSVHAIFSSFGIFSILLGPLPLLFSHLRLPDPWPKVTAIAGAILALTVFETPYPLVIAVFAVSLVVADGVKHEVAFWSLLRNLMLLTVIGSGAAVVAAASIHHMAVMEYWYSQADTLVASLQAAIGPQFQTNWETIRSLLRYEAGYLVVSTVILCFWVSIGLAAHLNWMEENHAYSGKNLRALRVPAWLNALIVVTLAGAYLGAPQIKGIAGGLFKVGSCILFIQGCILLSHAFAKSHFQPWARTLVYAIAVVLGSSLVMAVGLFSPLVYKREDMIGGLK